MKRIDPYSPNRESVVYAVGTDGNALVYGTVTRKAATGHVTYTITNRMGVALTIDADSINALINALTIVSAT